MRPYLLLLLALVIVLAFPTVAQEETDAPVLTMGSFGAVMRESPSSDADVVSRIDSEEVAILAVNPDESYYLVVFEVEIGWVSSGMTTPVGDLSQLPILVYSTIDDIPQIMIEDSVTLYQLPDAESEVIAEIEEASLYILAIDESEAFLFTVYEGQPAWLSIEALGDDSELDLSELAVIGGEASIEPCFVSTNDAGTVRVRVGFGENRTSVTFLEANTEFEALGQNTDDNGDVWYALDKEIAAPGKSIRGDLAWVLATEVDSTGDCDALPIMRAEEVLAPPPTPDPGGVEPGGESSPGSENSLTVIVPAASAWFDTGITVSAGQSLVFSASGLVNIFPQCEAFRASGTIAAIGPDHDCSQWLVGPGGNRNQIISNSEGGLLLVGSPNGALIARIGNTQTFLVSTSGTFTATSSGTLHLRVNDSYPEPANNTGSFTVTITIQ